MEKLIHFLLRSKLLVTVLGILVFLAGYASYRSLPVDAFPDVTPALVQVFTETEGLAPEEVEKYVTYPVEVAMNGLPNLKEIRSISNFGLRITSYNVCYTKLLRWEWRDEYSTVFIISQIRSEHRKLGKLES